MKKGFSFQPFGRLIGVQVAISYRSCWGGGGGGDATRVEGVNHKVRIYKKYHSVCPLVGIGTLTTPLSPASVPLHPGPGGTFAAVRGWGSPNSDDWRKSLALCLLRGVNRVKGGGH
jgi:hypothetical protein